MRFAFIMLLLFTCNIAVAQTNEIPDLAATSTILVSKSSGWNLSSTDKAPFADGPGYYFYFTKDNKLFVYTQRRRGDSNRELIISTTYSLFPNPDDQIGIIINNFHGDIKRLVLKSVTTSAPTEFLVVFHNGNRELELRNFPKGIKRYYSNKFL